MISIIIVNYRSWDYLRNCLNSIHHIEGFEIVVVDNFSNDGKISEFISDYPQVKWIQSNMNLGFGKACNLGALNATGGIFLFLNPDTIAGENAIARMKTFLDENINYKIVSCKQHEKLSRHFLLFPNVFRIFGLLRALSVKWNQKKFETKEKNDCQFIEPDWVSGSVLMISKDWFKKINGWSEEFWMYSEDLEICKKTEMEGGKMALLTDVQIYHKHGGASRKNIETTAMAKAEVIKSKHVYYQKYFSGFSRVFVHSVLIISFVLKNLPLAIVGLLFIFLPKLYLQTLIFKNLLKYYFNVLKNHTWMSERALNNTNI